MTMYSLARWRTAWLGLGLLIGPVVSAQTIQPDAHGFIALQPEEIQSPDGSIQTIILGDPQQPGPYVVRVTFAPGQGSRPHVHSQDRYATVIRGTWWVALGPDATTYDPTQMVPMKPGSFVLHPANAPHYDGAKDEEVVVQISGIGPVTTTMLETPADRPR